LPILEKILVFLSAYLFVAKNAFALAYNPTKTAAILARVKIIPLQANIHEVCRGG